MRSHSGIGVLAIAAASIAGPSILEGLEPMTRSRANTGRSLRKATGSLADQPHKHAREIARRLRQQKASV